MTVEHAGDLQINWGDGCHETNTYQHTYVDSNEHTIKLYGKSLVISKLDIQNSQVVFLDISNCPKLEELWCGSTLLRDLDVEKNRFLLILACQNNKLISKLDITRNFALKELLCDYMNINHLDLSKNVNLEYLGISELKLDSLPLYNLSKLKMINCNNCSLESLNFTRNLEIESIMCGYNQLTSINVSNNLNLKYLSCEGNRLNYIDVSRNVNLESLNVSYNVLESLNLANNLEVNSVNVVKNPILYNNKELIKLINSLPLKETTNKGFLSVWDTDVADQIRPLVESINWTVY